jgi:hypothetical protein
MGERVEKGGEEERGARGRLKFHVEYVTFAFREGRKRYFKTPFFAKEKKSTARRNINMCRACVQG